MRETPWYISKAIHARDPLADVRWDDRLHVWVLYWDNVRICALFHADGSDMHSVFLSARVLPLPATEISSVV